MFVLVHPEHDEPLPLHTPQMSRTAAPPGTPEQSGTSVGVGVGEGVTIGVCVFVGVGVEVLVGVGV